MNALNSKRTGAIPPIIGILLFFALIAGSLTYFLNNGPSSSPVPHEPENGLNTFTSYDELEAYVRDYSGGGYYGGVMMESAVKSAVDTQAGGAPTAPVSSDYSGTNIQVEGVDEADIVKSDGKYIYAVSGSKISVIDAYPAESANIVSTIDFNGVINEIFVNGDKLVFFGQKREEQPVPEGDDAEVIREKMMIYPRYSPKTTVMVYDISERQNPQVFGDIELDGSYHDSRMIGKYVYVIANQPTYYTEGNEITTPRICSGGRCISTGFHEIFYFDGVPGNTFTTIAAVNIEAPGDIESKVILTSYTQNMYVSENNIYLTYTKWLSEIDYIDRMVEIIKPIVPQDVHAKINAVMALEISKNTKWQAVSDIMEGYMATLSSDERRELEQKGQEKMEELMIEIEKERQKTIVQKISINQGAIEYIGSGKVPGNTLNQFSMDEYNGYFRIATTTSGGGGIIMPRPMVAMERTEMVQIDSFEAPVGMAVAPEPESTVSAEISAEEQKRMEEMASAREIPPRPPERSLSKNHVYVLDKSLDIVGRLEDLAPGERIYSVRFMGEKAYMVTFRQIDPLYVIDLSNPQNPNVLGFLKIPGVSDYMHPYDENHVIGVGRDATEDGRMQGMKLSLFDVSDVANPKEISKYMIGERGTNSEALNDHKAFLFSREKNLLVIPVQVSEGGVWNAFHGAYVFHIDTASGISLKGKITHTEEATSEDKYYYDYASRIRRALYMDDVLYTLSEKMLKMNSLIDIAEINKIELPYEVQKYPEPLWV